jgi:hypothetical protein
VNLSTDANKRIALWALSGTTGVSASTIARVALGIKHDGGRVSFDCPHDADDFGRCLRLLSQVPELHEYLPAVVEACPQWAPLVPIWSELTLLYAESPSLCNDRFRDVRDNCREAGGWRKIGEGTWVRTQPLPPGDA